jgi:uncharacterized membrane protein YedE/YeeE
MSLAEFSLSAALTGGALIGFAAVLLMLSIGKIAGVSGIVAGLLKPQQAAAWQWAFGGGLILSGLLVRWLFGPFTIEIVASKPLLIVAGLLVGFGTRLGGGCTSGHGVCGVSRLAPRSLVATAVFMAAGIVTVYVIRHILDMGAGA